MTKLSREPSGKLRLLDKRNITIHNPSREEACECHKKNRCFPENEKEISCRNWRERDIELPNME